LQRNYYIWDLFIEGISLHVLLVYIFDIICRILINRNIKQNILVCYHANNQCRDLIIVLNLNVRWNISKIRQKNTTEDVNNF